MPPLWGLVLIMCDHYKDTAPDGASEAASKSHMFQVAKKIHLALIIKCCLMIGEFDAISELESWFDLVFNIMC